MMTREEMMVRSDELRARFAEKASDPVVDNAVGLTLLSTGFALGITMILRGRRSAIALLLPLGFVFAGLAVMGGGFAVRRSDRIEETEGILRDRLLALDPIARAQVVRNVAPDVVPLIKPAHN